MEEKSPPKPPQGYVHLGHLLGHVEERWEQMSAWRRLTWANLIALIPLAAGIPILWLPYQFYLAWGAPLAYDFDANWASGVIIAAGVVSLAISVVIHELIHGLVLIISGHTPRFLVHYGVPIADIPAGCYLTRKQYLLVALAPLAIMTPAGAVALLFLPPNLGQILLAILLLNMAASVGDLYVARYVRLAPSSALFANQQGIQVFVPAGIKP
jgi:hypothetical protein